MARLGLTSNQVRALQSLITTHNRGAPEGPSLKRTTAPIHSQLWKKKKRNKQKEKMQCFYFAPKEPSRQRAAAITEVNGPESGSNIYQPFGNMKAAFFCSHYCAGQDGDI